MKFGQGHTPWNKGKKGVCKPNSGSFKKGMKVSEKLIDSLKSNRGRAWKGGVIYNQQGRKLVYTPDHPNCDSKGYVRYSRLVVEKSLGRFLLPDETIHHINEDKTDDNINNLYLFPSKSAHTYFHWHKTELTSNLL